MARGVWHIRTNCICVGEIKHGFRCMAGLVTHGTLGREAGAARQERLEAAAPSAPATVSAMRQEPVVVPIAASRTLTELPGEGVLIQSTSSAWHTIVAALIRIGQQATARLIMGASDAMRVVDAPAAGASAGR
eukprot:84538-Pleurochrysis_carterae.AAC.4